MVPALHNVLQNVMCVAAQGICQVIARFAAVACLSVLGSAAAWVFFIGSMLGVIFGHLAMQQIHESEGREVGRGNAMIGLIVGYAGLACGLLALLILLG